MKTKYAVINRFESKIQDLIPGDTFLDSFGIPLKVVRTEPLPWLEIPGTKPKTRVYFQSGRHLLFQSFASDRKVKLVSK